MTELYELDALSQAAAVQSGEVGVVELVRHHLDRVAAHGSRLGVFVTVTEDAALEEAHEAEKRLRADPDGLPQLFGVPTAVKDLAATAGVRTTFGSRAYADLVPAVDAHCVSLLRQAGTISLGKTNTAEFGLNAYTESEIAGSARTPWDPTAMADLAQISLRAMLATQPFDAVLSPTVAKPPQTPDWFTGGPDAEDTGAAHLDELIRQTSYVPFNALQNVTGKPAVNVPLHWTADSLPIGVTLSGRMGRRRC